MSQRRGKRHGFTLIELLVVIAIITVLAAIVLPVYAGAQQRARMAQCQSNLSAIAIAMKLYRQEYKRYPLGALAGNVDDLPDQDGKLAYLSTDTYHTVHPTTGRRTRINALFPNYIEDQKSLICPDEDLDSALVLGEDPAAALNGQDSDVILEVGGDGSLSTYDDFYNVFGYANGDYNGIDLDQGTPITRTGNQVGGGRKAQRLNNPYCPGGTIITYCREHEFNFDANATVSILVRIDGKSEKVIRQVFNWQAQAEQAYN